MDKVLQTHYYYHIINRCEYRWDIKLQTYSRSGNFISNVFATCILNYKFICVVSGNSSIAVIPSSFPVVGLASLLQELQARVFLSFFRSCREFFLLAWYFVILWLSYQRSLFQHVLFSFFLWYCKTSGVRFVIQSSFHLFYGQNEYYLLSVSWNAFQLIFNRLLLSLLMVHGLLPCNNVDLTSTLWIWILMFVDIPHFEVHSNLAICHKRDCILSN